MRRRGEDGLDRLLIEDYSRSGVAARLAPRGERRNRSETENEHVCTGQVSLSTEATKWPALYSCGATRLNC